MDAVFIPSASPLGLSCGSILMESVELSSTSLAEAMFEKLGLPKPVYFVHHLSQDRFRTEIQFHRTKARYDASARRTKVSSRTCQNGVASMNHALDKAIEYMQNREGKVLVDYNYYQLEQMKMAHTRLSTRLPEQSDEINQHIKTIKQITKEACNYVEQVRNASNRIQDLAAVFLDPATSMCVSNMKQAIMEIHSSIVVLQSSTTTTSRFLEEKGMYSDDEVPEQSYSGHLDEDSADDIHQHLDDDYVPSP
ncbi:hypothetical protein CFC21_034499 [Triticum aestivum]|uniref:Uncharacterized protein n=3 Tax=Triticum TaxID=4564 RepID=A0A9R0RD30_TRITD|nr:hypothetical protein CFC21_034499 [Triticum aestivum]VAH58243.1 unnamed protein product [Triticum turgidum subsp. durum]